MDIQIRVEPTYEDFYHANMLAVGRTGINKYAFPATLLYFLFLVVIITIMYFLYGLKIEEVLIFILLTGMILALCFFLFIFLPRRIKKLYRQSMNLYGAPEYRFTENGVHTKSQYGESTIPWEKYAKWMEDPEILVLFQTDNTINLFPKRYLTQEQTNEIRQAITSAKIPAHKINRILPLLGIGLVVFAMTPIACWLVFRFMLYLFQ
jgi:hypothetical protein